MFTQLAPLAAKATLLIVVAPLAGDRLRLTITLKADAEKKTSLAPFLVEGTPPELDEGLPAALQTYVEKNISLADALVAADGEIAAIEKEKQTQLAAARRPAGKAETKKPDSKLEAATKPPAASTDTLPLTLESETAGAPTAAPATLVA
jgi:PRTRC genetic system protein E